MGLTCRAVISGTRFLFEDFGRDGFFHTWQWKLDPYRIPDDGSISDVVIRSPISGVPEQGCAVLSSERSGFFSREILRAADGGTLWRFVRNASDRVYLSYKVSGNFQEVSLLTDETESAGTMGFEYLGQMMPCVLLNRGILTFHGVLVEYAESGIAICAPSGTGKTTHARLWRNCKNALILNGDRTVVSKSKDGWLSWGTPWSGTSGEQINRSAPLKALVVLEQGSENRAERVSPQVAVRRLLPHLMYPAWDEALTMKAFDLMDDLLRSIPVYCLACRPDADAVEVLCREMDEVL